MSALDWTGVALLGGVGSLMRFFVDRAISSHARLDFPSGTFVVNASGTLVLGILAGAAISGHALLLEGTATIGSYTTFSTWIFEAHRLGEDGRFAQGAANVLLSIVMGLGAVALGRLIGQTL